MIYDLEILKRDLVVLQDVNTFLVQVPNYHPDHPHYTSLWKKYFQYCIEGLWGYDNGGWRFMPPTLFFYANFFKIQHTEKGKKTRSVVKPNLRDLDWLLHYSYLEAQGFSGFTLDDKWSCDIALINEDYYKELETSDKKELRERFLHLHRSDGKKKEYITPRVYIKKLHHENLGKPLYYNPARNVLFFGARGGKLFTASDK